MAERKIFNFESKILRDRTIEVYGYDPDTLGRCSRLYVMATCRYCGKEMRILKGNFNKLGSACHKECRIETLKKQDSPFNNPETQAKAKNRITELYGEDRKSIGEKISQTKNTKESKQRYIDTCQEKYGVDNLFQHEEIKEKIRETNLLKYGDTSAARSAEIQKKKVKTTLQRYGVEYAFLNSEVRDKIVNSFKSTILSSEEGKYTIAKILNSDEFWELLKTKTLTEISKHFGVEYYALVPSLMKKQYKDKYYEIYQFPTMQTQKDIYNIIKKDLNIDCELSNRSVISPLELDVYVPSHNFAIEYNGVYFHSEKFIKDIEKAKNKHIIKTNKCDAVGVKLLHIYEDQWISRCKQIVSLIRRILKRNENTIYSDKCDYNNEDNLRFLENNSICSLEYKVFKYFNLSYDSRTVMSMTASKIDDESVLLSYLFTVDNTNVPGGSSRLFEYFKIWSKENGYKRIISWSDNCWTQGNIYKVLGFNLEKEYGPDYFYWHLTKHYHLSKQSQRKNNTNCPKGMTERDWAIQNDLTRVWDCGKKKWVYEL